MRHPRLKLSGCEAVYHCMSRVVNGERLFGDREKEVLRRMLWQAAGFTGVEVITYNMMDNHFHVLAEVPAGGRPGDGELARRFEQLYGAKGRYDGMRLEDLVRTLKAGGAPAEALRARLLARMGDVSEFMKVFKQRFTTWYNKTHGRYGTLWAERFKSVLVEGDAATLRTVAAYIDLNAVRAGMVADPKDYRFCGYAEALGGSRRARRGLLRACGDLALYRQTLFGKGASPWTKKGLIIDIDKARRVIEKEGGRLPAAALLRCRVRYFTEGLVLGSGRFVGEIAGKTGGGKPAGLPPGTWEQLAVLRKPRGPAFG